MKKILAIILIIMCATALVSCKNRKNGQTEKTDVDPMLVGWPGGAYSEIKCTTAPFTSKAPIATTEKTSIGCGIDERYIFWEDECGATENGTVYVIRNSEWSLSSNAVSYGKLILSPSGISENMMSVCPQTKGTYVIFDEFDEDFFEENVLLYLTVNSSDTPVFVDKKDVEKGKSLSVCIGVAYTNEGANSPHGMCSYTVLVSYPREALTGGEQINVSFEHLD
ncbi:MAG: hypothetical protein IJW21_04790 [Clostridia bacterium]|nr:hypothetical protein [Clostridia bacterium]